VCVVGARPNFMKIKPVMDALQARGVDVVLIHTGQHYDRSMSTVFFEDLGIRSPDRWLNVGSGSHAEQTAGVMIAFDPVLAKTEPDVVVVVGDVNSTMAAALVTAKSPARLAHVEAGLRSGDWTMPEEVNRLVTDSVCDDLLAPSPDAVENLLAEGHPEERVHLVGNVMIDTLFANLERARNRSVLDDLGLEPQHYGLVTLHRPANVDEPAMLKSLLGAFG
jgi:UDP-N-acetylglucosamine 2-epimerase (non-hydrolysing)